MCKKFIYLISFVLLLGLSGNAFAWGDQTIGTMLAGNANENPPGTWTVQGDGDDIWGTTDNFHYVYKYLKGDGSITARVANMAAGTSEWGKAGVMMRETLTGPSTFIDMVQTVASTGGTAAGGGGSSFQWRPSTGANCGNTDSAVTVGVPLWVRVERVGDAFTGWRSYDNITWTQVGTPQTNAMRHQPGAPYPACWIGLCVTSHATGELRTAVFDNISYTGDVSETPPLQLTAFGPTPADGATNQLKSILRWSPGDTAAAHDVYFGTDRTAVENADASSPLCIEPGITVLYSITAVSLQTTSTTYYWRIDELDVDGVTVYKGDVWTFGTAPLKTHSPSPVDTSWYVDPCTPLSWGPGFTARYHEVYLGTDRTAVESANTSSVLYKGRKAPGYLPGTLTKDTFYYWRVDEVESVQTIKHKGNVWSFKVTPSGLGQILRELWLNIGGGVLVSDLTGNANYPDNPSQQDMLTAFASPQTAPDTENYGGRIHGLLHVPLAGDYTFWIASDDYSELWLSTDDDPANATLICQVPGWTNYQIWDTYPQQQQSAPITLSQGKHYIMALWKEGGGGDHCAAAWQGPGIPTRTVIAGNYLAPYVRYWAYAPNPANNATDVGQEPTLIWKPGVKTLKHNIYFGDDQTIVANATTSTAGIYKGQYDVNSYDPPGLLDLGQTYYWRIDEVNTLNPDSPWRGNVWSFTVANYFVLEDYERYTNTTPLKIFETWIAAGGGKVGYNDPNYAQTYIRHAGSQSMPFDYSNLDPPKYSEATRTFAATDFGKYGVKALSLWTRGYPPYMGSFLQAPAGTYTMTAGGEDIWDVPDIRHPSTFHDEFHYAYTQVSGNCLIIAKVESVSNTNAWAKAGVMVRDSLDDNSIHAMVCMTPGSGASFQYRSATGGASTNYGQDVNVATPYWVAIERQGDMFYGVYCADGVSWAPLGQMTITMPDPVYVGLCLTSHNPPVACKAVFTNVSINQAPPPALTNQDIGIKSNVVAPLYVTLQDSGNATATVTNPDANAVLSYAWQAWDIPMSSFTGITKSAITKLTVGVGTHSVSTGTIYVDDIRLYMPRCRPDLLRNPADFTGDCLVDYYDLDILTDSWLVKPPTAISSGLKGYWPFNGTLQDVSGNGRHGSDPCGVITYAGGYAGQAASLNGGYVRVGPVGISGAASRSVAGWAKASTMNMLTTDWINVFGFTCRSGTLTDRSFDINKWGAGNDYAIHVYGWERAIMPVDLEWHHLAASYDGTTIRWYGDGQLVGSDSSRVLDTNDLVQMGERGDISANFQGMIDEVRIYGRALSQAEVEYLAGTTMIDINNDGSIDFKDYALMADVWLEELLWPQ